MDLTRPYKFVRFGATDVAKPYKVKGFGAMDVTKPYNGVRVAEDRLLPSVAADGRWSWPEAAPAATGH